MRKLLLLITAIFCSVVLTNAQELFEVTAESPLNVRSAASTNGSVIGTLPNGATVEVYEYYGPWAKIKYNDRDAYVNINYLKKCDVQPNTVSTENKQKQELFWNKIDLEQYATHNVKWMAFVILGLSIILAIMRKRESGYIIYLILFSLTCLIELIYLLKMGSDRLWFCMPREVGWGWTIVGFITFGWLSYNQLMCFIHGMSEIKAEEGDFDMRIGLYSWPIAIIAAVVAHIFKWEGCNPWIVIILGICQLIQIVMIIIGVKKYSGFGHGFLAAAIYLLGAISTLMVMIQFLALLIIVLIAGVIIIGLLSASGKSSGSSSSSSSNGSNEGYLDYADGCGRISGYFSDDNTFHEYGGGTYERQYDDTWKKRDW